MELVLLRTYYPEGTNGDLWLGDEGLCHTIELPWKENAHNISCIPEGRYELEKRYSPKFQWHVLLKNVQDRSLILIHPANDAMKELRGCIAPVTVLTGPGKGIQSRLVFEKLKGLIYPVLDRGEKVYLNIQSLRYETDHQKGEEADT
ncbi:MAG: hypothetical protein KGO81_06065 [Bacteroidota bacterium]|nr:hypothetical protein [Bacteroidota bacterium]